MTHSHFISKFVGAIQQDLDITREEKGRQIYEAIDFLEEVLANYPDPREIDDDQ